MQTIPARRTRRILKALSRHLGGLRRTSPVEPNPFRALAVLLAEADCASDTYIDLCIKAGLLDRYAAARHDETEMMAHPALAAAYADNAGERELLLRIVERVITGCRRGEFDKRTLARVLKRGWSVDAKLADAACEEFQVERPIALTLALDPAAASRLAIGSTDASLHLAAANEVHAPEAKLARINTAMAALGQSPLSTLRPERAPSVDNLAPAVSRRTVAATGLQKVSVIMTCFDCAPYLAAALESVLQQTWQHLEVIVADDASRDDSWAIVQAFAQRDARVRGIRTARNVGTYAAKNVALAQATGDFVAFNDADDWSHPERLERALERFVAQPRVVAVGGHYFRLADDGRICASKPYPLIRRSTNSIVFRRRTVVERIGYFDENRFGSDSEYVARLRAEFGESAHELLPQVQHIACQRKGSLMHGDAYGIDAMGYSEPRRRYEEFWAERLLTGVRQATGLYLPRGLSRPARLFPAPGPGGPVQDRLPVHELALWESC